MFFVDAQEMAYKYPQTFETPSPTELNALMPGDYVKVCALNERFWVELTQITFDKLIGTVANDLVRIPLKFGEPVTFTRKNVYAIMKKDNAQFCN